MRRLEPGVDVAAVPRLHAAEHLVDELLRHRPL
jgi:hypothetical protein